MKRFAIHGILASLIMALPLTAETLYTAPTHGTVNILLGTQEGLVILTDSRLSSAGKIEGSGLKLFKIDPYTVCAVAGFYTDPGPAVGRFPGFRPLYTSMPALINRAAVELSRAAPLNLPLSEKARRIEEVLLFYLDVVADADQMAGIDRAPVLSEISMAGYDNGVLKIYQAKLVPHPTKRASSHIYEEEDAIERTLGDEVALYSAGMDTPAQLAFVDASAGETLDDPNAIEMLSMVRADRSKKISLEGLQKIAISLENKVAQTYPHEVGGPMQIAKLEGGGIVDFDQPVPASTVLSTRFFTLIDNFVVSDPPEKRNEYRGFDVGAGRVLLASNGRMNNLTQRLDRVFFTNTLFEHVNFEYTGSPLTVFDTSNQVFGCKLILGSADLKTSSFVQSLLAKYPDIRIEVGHLDN